MIWVDTLYSSGDTLTACFIKLSQPEDSMETGDLVSLNLEIPSLPYRSIFSELFFQDIPILNGERKPLFTYKDFIGSDSKKKEDSVYAAIINDFHNTWTQLKDRNDLSNTYLQKASAGRFEGKSILDVLRDVKRQDLESFLLYLKSYVSSYRGTSHAFYESFAGWLSVNSPYSSIEIKQVLLPVYKNKTEFEKLLPIYKADILRGHSCILLGDEAVSLCAENYSQGLQLLDFAKTLAIAVRDTAGEAYVQLCKAQVYEDKGD